MIKTAKNPSGKEIVFNEEDHTYCIDTAYSGSVVGEQYLTSVTTFIDQYFPEFDSETVSKEYAKKNNLDQANVLAQWKKKADDASDLGDIVHLYAERLFKEEILPGSVNPIEITMKYKDETLNILHKVQKYFNAVNKTVIKLLKRFEFIDAEMIVFSESLGVAGTIDLLMRDRENGDIVIFDWKTNEKIEKENPWQNAFKPLDHLPDCNFSKYQLQLNIYKKILIEERYFPLSNYRMALIHLTESNVEWYKIEDMDQEMGWESIEDNDIPF